MKLFLTLLYTIYSTTEIHSSKNHCSNFTCGPYDNTAVVCVKLIQSKGPPVFQIMHQCAAIEFQCHADNPYKVLFVPIAQCYKTTPPMNFKRLKRDLPISIEENDDRQRKYPVCPTGCPAARTMVCVRYGKDLYRSFMSECYLRMHQCKHPEEKLELVSRRACYAAAPVLAGTGISRLEDSLEPPGNGSDYTDSRTDSYAEIRLNNYRWTPPPFENLEKTPKPTADVPWLTRRTRSASRHTTNSHRNTATQDEPEPDTDWPPHKTTTDSGPDSPDESYKNKNEHFTVENVYVCEEEEDEETPIDVPDVCPSSTIDNILTTEREYMVVEIHPDEVEDMPPVWTVWNHGTDVTTRSRADAGIVLGCETYAGVDFSGRVFVNSFKDYDFIGFVFGYRSNRLFYLVTWKAISAKYWVGSPFVAKADAGLHIKLVNSSTGPGPNLRNSIFNTKSVKDQVTLLWQDPDKQGWKHMRWYNWRLIHRPHIGLIRMKIFRHNDLVVDTGNIYNSAIEGGRIGFFCFSQEEIEWTKMSSKCNDKIPSNVMSELPPDLQEKSVEDSDYVF